MTSTQLHTLNWSAMIALISTACFAGPASAEPPFRALPRPIHYETPLLPAKAPKAVIVYGKNAPWTRQAAREVQKQLKAWGVELEITDDMTVTSEETWLLAEAYSRTPLIVLGNARDNRLLHAVGTRFLAYSNRTWPGGDRFVLRTIFEPFRADVNFIAIEASTPKGLRAAVARFGKLLSTVQKDAQATLPHTILAEGVKDKWAEIHGNNWGPPPSYADLSKSVTQIALVTQNKPFPGWRDGVAAAICMGGFFSEKDPQKAPPREAMKAVAADLMNRCRSVGGRTHQPGNHYGGMNIILALRYVMQSGVLSPEEFNEFESYLALSGAHPNEYFYNHIGNGDERMNAEGGRHFCACLLITCHTLDYVKNHCSMDAATLLEIDRRSEGLRKVLGYYNDSFRDNGDTTELGESTLMIFYSLLHQGQPQVVKNGKLKLMADMYALSTDNIRGFWGGVPGCYAGLDSYICAYPGGAWGGWHGRGLLAAAAWYYDDPQYRWYVQQLGSGAGMWGSVATGMLLMHYDSAGAISKPTRYDGVASLPLDKRLYTYLSRPVQDRAWNSHELRMPPFEKGADRVAFRDGMSSNDAYMFLATTWLSKWLPFQNNTIARYTDLGDLWLFHNTKHHTTWGRNAFCVSNGKPYVPAGGCTMEALANLGPFSIVASKEIDTGGADCTRTIVHLKGHYFVVLDTAEARQDGPFNLVCRWRTGNQAAIEQGVWTVQSPQGNTFHIQNTQSLKQTNEQWEWDGSAKPQVLSQFKSVTLTKGQRETIQNLLYVSGPKRRDEFTTRQVGPQAQVVAGTCDGRPHQALIGTGGNMPLSQFQSDAVVYVLTDNKLHLAGVTLLEAKTAKGMTPIFQSPSPVNLLLDCVTGIAQIDVPAQQAIKVRTGVEAADKDLQQGKSQLQLAQNGELPLTTEALSALWESAPAPKADVVREPSAKTDNPLLDISPCDKPLVMPWRRIPSLKLTSVPEVTSSVGLDWLAKSNFYLYSLPNNAPTWNSKKVELTLTLEERQDLSHVRLVSIMDFGFRGRPIYGKDDLTFSVVLSDDGFQKDLRTIDHPEVVYEETGLEAIHHWDVGRLPTFRIAINQPARQVRIKIEALNPKKPYVALTQVEVYAADLAAAGLRTKAFAADINGDGANELVVGTSNKEVAAYDAAGKQLWSRSVPGEIFTMQCADMDEDGKSEILVFTLMEQLHCFDGLGKSQYVGDLYQAQVRNLGKEQVEGASAGAGVLAMAAWGPDDPKRKEVILWAGYTYVVKADGSSYGLGKDYSGMGQDISASTRLVGIYPGEPEVLASVGRSITLWSKRRSKNGLYIQLASTPTVGEFGSQMVHKFGWAQTLNLPAYKGLLAANEGGINWCPVESFLPGSKVQGWGFSTAGVPVVAAAAFDVDDDSVPEVFLARQDGFVNVLSLADGKMIAILNAGEPILSVAGLKDRGGKPIIMVATAFGLQLYGADFKKLGQLTSPAVAC
ncbi:MAG: VCBS repeat-containing protein, partial [Planctomycetes bacterium]|nr:VCBS repeat-containing protein [Planctomycetota bacterium]